MLELMRKVLLIICTIHGIDKVLHFSHYLKYKSRYVYLYGNYQVASFYDSLIAKVIGYGENRSDAASKLREALGSTFTTGVFMTLSFCEDIISHVDFAQGHYSNLLSNTFLKQG